MTKHTLLSGKALNMGNDTDRDSGMQGQMISLVVNVAYMHHWTKPSQTAFRHSAIWRWPRAYSGRPLLHKMWCFLSHSNTSAHQTERNVCWDYFCHAESCMHSVNVDEPLTPASERTLASLPSSLSLAPEWHVGYKVGGFSTVLIMRVKLVRVIFSVFLSSPGNPVHNSVSVKNPDLPPDSHSPQAEMQP